MTYRPDPKNARRHPDRNKQMIRRSLEEVGPFRSIAIDGDGIVRAGNGVYEQAQALGLKVREIEAAPDELIAVRRPDLRGDQAELAALWDNRTAETAERDASVLSEYADVFDLSELFSEDELSAHLERAGSDIVGAHDPPAPASPTVSQWLIIIECADETQQVEQLERLTAEGLICRALQS